MKLIGYAKVYPEPQNSKTGTGDVPVKNTERTFIAYAMKLIASNKVHPSS
jgi:hypothetical protein